MKENIKNNEPQGCTKYVPASVKVIEVTAQRVLCGSGLSFGLGNDTFTSGDSEDPWAE